ncbi:MAG: UDP-galactopyranose mutase [Cyclobacteriaceae bacterium]|nr:UDP-galactopyranose mutase [Cyclobacteriaceae bacterium]
MKQYDYLIVGAGLFGSVFAHEAKKRGKRCLVVDKRNHIGGNVYCEKKEGITVHKYGAHIFHTNDKTLWEYVNSFIPFNHYRHTVLANYDGELYNLPFNMNTFYRLWGVTTPAAAKQKINEQILGGSTQQPTNLEEQALSLVGFDIYNKLIKGYTEKQWGRPATSLPAFIIKRLPVRFTFNNDYFTDTYQGIPKGGYTALIEKMLLGSEVRLAVDYFQARQELDMLAEKVVFTGMIDQFYDYRFGVLEYRSLHFEHQLLELANYQGSAVVNYTNSAVPYTRIIEHKHFEFGEQPSTYITYEYPQDWTSGKEPYYPINDSKNDAVFKKYKALAQQEEKVIFGGRLAEYRYYDMHQVIASALKTIETHFAE